MQPFRWTIWMDTSWKAAQFFSSRIKIYPLFFTHSLFLSLPSVYCKFYFFPAWTAASSELSFHVFSQLTWIINYNVIWFWYLNLAPGNVSYRLWIDPFWVWMWVINPNSYPQQPYKTSKLNWTELEVVSVWRITV